MSHRKARFPMAPSPWPFPAGKVHTEPREQAQDRADEAKADQPRPPRWCSVCRQVGGHAQNCPADEDYEEEIE